MCPLAMTVTSKAVCHTAFEDGKMARADAWLNGTAQDNSSSEDGAERAKLADGGAGRSAFWGGLRCFSSMTTVSAE